MSGEVGKNDDYTSEEKEEVWLRMCDGESVNSISKIPGMPSKATIYKWKIYDIDSWADKHTRAQIEGMQTKKEEIMDTGKEMLELAKDNKVGMVYVNAYREYRDAVKFAAILAQPRDRESSNKDVNIKIDLVDGKTKGNEPKV